jgi:protoheme IX farnesyltransferase
MGISGRGYFLGAVVLGIAQFCFCLRIWNAKLAPSEPRAKLMARQLLQASVLYLPLLFALMMMNSINY